MICSRDGLFVENTVYNSLEPDLNRLTLELIGLMTYTLPPLNTPFPIIEMESDE